MIDLGFSLGSGALSSTAEDLYRWGIALHRNRLFDLDRQIESDWPYGWGKTEVGDLRGVEQTGATDGFMSSLAVFDDGTIVVVLHNLERGDWSRIGRDVASIALGAPYEIPTERELVDLPSDLGPFVGTYESDGRQIEVREVDGALWQFTPGWRKGKWLALIGTGRFTIPADWGEMRFEALGAEGYGSLYWDFGESGVRYERVSSLSQ